MFVYTKSNTYRIDQKGSSAALILMPSQAARTKVRAILISPKGRRSPKRWRLKADREGWPTAEALALLAEYELAERQTRRIHRNLAASRLPAGKTLVTFDFDRVPEVSCLCVEALAANDWLAGAGSLIAIGNSDSGKTHLLAP